MSNILTASNLTKSYNTQVNKTVVRNVTISINSGEIYVIEGKSGSGKSTLLSMLGGMEKPNSGKVYYNNASLYDLPDKQQAKIRGKSFGFVFQSFQLIPELTVKENIELPLQFIDKQHRKWKTAELANELGIRNHLHKRPSALSGGEQQRAAIARALITSPEIIFADEPTGNLDQATTGVIVDLLMRLNARQGVAVVIVTHEKQLIPHPHHFFNMQDGVLTKVNYEVV